ncbi:MAG: hypothetical protein GTO71_13820 [Woeseiaceae bacterium]|nr:hypothetical protein [Woeseiaceae bacterium]NIP22137.1 hypothetical protein [Woeseiaceae bacterium]NIS91303.1 hypothetical protein [Woeseiaceae bacterium]
MKTRTLIAAIPFVVAASATVANDVWQSDFPLDGYTLTATGDHPYWSLKPGRFVVLASIEADGSEVVVISVLDETEMVDGVETRVIEEREYEDGELAEISRNFFAMAEETGDVFYFGEDVDYYKDGQIVGHDGEWRAGIGEAKAGLYMPARPEAGMKYYMEYDPSSAMDRAEIIETDATVETARGTFRNSLIITESSPLEPDDESYKRYAPKVGMIYDDGLELYKYGRRFPSERYIEFEITEDQMPKIPRDVVYELHPTGVIREVKVEIRKTRAFYAVETFIDGDQWDVEVLDDGEVKRNTPD